MITPLGQLILDLLEHADRNPSDLELREILHRFDPDLKNQEHVNCLKVKKRDQTN